MKKLELIDERFGSHGDISGKRKPKQYFSEARGSFLYDTEGVRYLDFQMFNASSVFGYGSKQHNQVLIEQLNHLPALASEFMHTERVLLTEKIAKTMLKSTGKQGRVHFCVGGAQAVEEAIKLVANKTGSARFFAFEGGYHGRTLGASRLSSSFRYRRPFGGIEPARFVPYPNCFRCPYGKKRETCELYCVDQFERLFENEYCGIRDKNGRCEYVAFIFEPILGRGGYVFPPEGYFERLCRILNYHRIKIVVDEVQMGVFRTGKMWSFEHYNIVPDVLIFGKAMSNGLYPLSGVWAREELINPKVWPVGSSHATFSTHPLATALGVCTFDVLKKNNASKRCEEIGGLIRASLDRLQKRFKQIQRVQGKGLAHGFEICHDDSSPDTDLAERISVNIFKPIVVCNKKTALIMTRGGFSENAFMLSPNMYSSAEEICLFEELFCAAMLRSVCR